MNLPNIVLPDGSPLTEECIKPIKLGYQIVHMDTGRILPTTRRNQIYTAWAAAERLGDVALSIPTLDAMDYIMKPLYDHERPDNCQFVNSLMD